MTKNKKKGDGMCLETWTTGNLCLQRLHEAVCVTDVALLEYLWLISTPQTESMHEITCFLSLPTTLTYSWQDCLWQNRKEKRKDMGHEKLRERKH